MKRRISDLLETCSDPNFGLEIRMPLSSERIKALTMNKISKTQRKNTRIVRRSLIAAAIIAALALSVFAVDIAEGSSWFRAFFESNIEDTLSQAQIEYIEENAVQIEQSQTIGGYTLQLESILCDEKSVYIKLNLYAPVGVVIPYEEYHRFDGIRLLASGEEIPWEYWGYSTLDEETTDHHIGVIMQVRLGEDVDTDSLMTGEALSLEVTGLTKSYGRFFERKTERLTDGTWAFTPHFTVADQQKYELISEPVPCMMVKAMTDEETKIWFTSVCVRTLGVDVVYDYPGGADLERLDWLGVKLIKKDGSVEQLLPSDSSIHPDAAQITGYISFTSDAPIIPEELACIEFPDGTQIPVIPEA